MRHIVLGHTGFLGSHVLRAVQQQGDEAIGHSRATCDLRQRGSLDALGLTAQDVLIFCSALTPEHCKDVDGFSDNVAMVANVARHLAAHPVAKCVYVSTDGIYPMIDGPVTEVTPPAPDNFYTISKYAGERLLQAVAGPRLLVVRPCGIYGAGDDHNAYGPNRFVRSIVSERVVRLFGEGEELRDHIHVDDVAALILRLVRADAAGVYNLATGSSVTFGQVVGMLRELAPFEVQHAARKGAVTHRRVDIARLRAACGDFAFTDLRTGLQGLLAHAQKNG